MVPCERRGKKDCNIHRLWKTPKNKALYINRAELTHIYTQRDCGIVHRACQGLCQIRFHLWKEDTIAHPQLRNYLQLTTLAIEKPVLSNKYHWKYKPLLGTGSIPRVVHPHKNKFNALSGGSACFVWTLCWLIYLFYITGPLHACVCVYIHICITSHMHILWLPVLCLCEFAVCDLAYLCIYMCLFCFLFDIFMLFIFSLSYSCLSEFVLFYFALFYYYYSLGAHWFSKRRYKVCGFR